MILKLHTGLIIFPHNYLVIFPHICSHEFTGGYPFFYFFYVKVCCSRTIGNKLHYGQETIKYIEQRIHEDGM